jgi:hypothetical protein
VVSFTPPPIYSQRKSPWYPLDRRLVDPRAVLDEVVRGKIPSPLLGLELPIIYAAISWHFVLIIFAN